MNGDTLEFLQDNINTPLKDRSDWPLPSFDARDWAESFCGIATELGYSDAKGNPVDQEWMVGWFANSLMRGYDEGRKAIL